MKRSHLTLVALALALSVAGAAFGARTRSTAPAVSQAPIEQLDAFSVAEVLANSPPDVVVVTLDDADTARHVVEQVRAEWPDLPVFARARDARHAQALLILGAREVVPETVEASLQLAQRVLEGVGVAEAVADRVVDRMRAEELAALKNPGQP